MAYLSKDGKIAILQEDEQIETKVKNKCSLILQIIKNEVVVIKTTINGFPLTNKQ